MKKQVHAIFIFIGIVFLATAFIQGKVVDTSSEAIAANQEDYRISDRGVASAVLALKSDSDGQENPFGLSLDYLYGDAGDLSVSKDNSGIQGDGVVDLGTFFGNTGDLTGRNSDGSGSQGYGSVGDLGSRGDGGTGDPSDGLGGRNSDDSGSQGDGSDGGGSQSYSGSGAGSGSFWWLTEEDEPEDYPEVEVGTPPTICNMFVLQPEIGSVVPNTFVVSGYVDEVPDTDCLWTVFEANAGGVEVYDDNNNLLSEYRILSSVGSWMQMPSYFQALIYIINTPETETGYIRVYEHIADESTPDSFDYPISFIDWGVEIEPEGNNFLDSLANFFRPRNTSSGGSVAPTPKSIFDRSEKQNIYNPVIRTGVGAPVVEKSDDYCEIKDSNNSLICSGSYIDRGSSVCGCSLFPSLETSKQKESLNSYQVDLSGIVFDKTLFFGDRGPQVVAVQEAMYALGLYDQIPSGVYDGKTFSSVKAFQKENGISGWGLVVGSRSREVLNSLFSN